MIVELARSSEAWCFLSGRWFFRSCLTASGRRQQNLSKNAVFLGFQTTRSGVFWRGFGTSFQKHGVSPLETDFFEVVWPLAAAGNRICRKISFSRISDDTLGNFLAWFCQRHGVSPPGRWLLFYCQQPQATESAEKSVEKCCFSRISDDTLGTFLAWFWN